MDPPPAFPRIASGAGAGFLLIAPTHIPPPESARTRRRDWFSRTGAWLVALCLGTGPVAAAGSSLWDDTVVPAVPSSSDTRQLEVGLRFRSDLDGYITAIRYYRGAENTGTHTGRLWTNAGVLLATAELTVRF